MTPEIAEEVNRLNSADVDSVLHAIRRLAEKSQDQKTLNIIQSYFDKWQGIPGDAAEAIVELRKRTVRTDGGYDIPTY